MPFPQLLLESASLMPVRLVPDAAALQAGAKRGLVAKAAFHGEQPLPCCLAKISVKKVTRSRGVAWQTVENLLFHPHLSVAHHASFQPSIMSSGCMTINHKTKVPSDKPATSRTIQNIPREVPLPYR